jgi:hypothetical protein
MTPGSTTITPSNNKRIRRGRFFQIHLLFFVVVDSMVKKISRSESSHGVACVVAMPLSVLSNVPIPAGIPIRNLQLSRIAAAPECFDRPWYSWRLFSHGSPLSRLFERYAT